MVLSVCFVSLVHTQQFLVKSTLSDSLINLDKVKFVFGLILNNLILDTDSKPDSDLHIEQIYLTQEMEEKTDFVDDITKSSVKLSPAIRAHLVPASMMSSTMRRHS